ncbi:AAA family ATPase [Neiella sp. HB171785]|uniref:AAA family ATPase n=1 Tax=Neiella litorisoli TaxID=2771431 RepID=A0A8J6ULT9_9GAMM|nr:ABC transporter ATP-binding protein [Neiella litorisoli]MBD1389505.1 AAA family ATPase [Neiella litorisoli]
MTDHLRFPSGKTVVQLKKDAKKVAAAKRIKLTAALDEIAFQNGADMPWSRAINWLKRPALHDISFSLPTNHGQLVVSLTQEKPVAVIVGETGTGKTSTALQLASEVLRNDVNVHWFGATVHVGTDPSMAELHRLKSLYSDQLSIDYVDNPAHATLTENSLVIVDEWYHSGTLQVEELTDIAVKNNCVLLVLVQELEPFESDVPNSLAFALLHSSCAAKEIAHRLVRGSNPSLAEQPQTPQHGRFDFQLITKQPQTNEAIFSPTALTL